MYATVRSPRNRTLRPALAQRAGTAQAVRATHFRGKRRSRRYDMPALVGSIPPTCGPWQEHSPGAALSSNTLRTESPTMMRCKCSSTSGSAGTCILAVTTRGRRRSRIPATSLLPTKLLENISANTRPHAVNINFGYTLPKSSNLWKNRFSELVGDGWNVEGILTYYFGTALTIGCSPAGNPIGYWTGTPSATYSDTSGALPFRCEMTGPLWLAGNATPGSVGSTASPALWYNFNPASFSLPPVNSLGIGNTPPTLTYGPGVENVDLSVFKQFRVWGEGKILELRFQAFNALNHFNPGNPNTSLTLNYATGANTNSAFGTITTAALPARHGPFHILNSRPGSVVSARGPRAPPCAHRCGTL